MDVIVDEGGEIAPHLHWHCIYLAISHVRERSREASVKLKCFQTGSHNFMLDGVAATLLAVLYITHLLFPTLPINRRGNH